MIMKKIPELQKTIIEICNDHYDLSKTSDANVNYLWYLYSQGLKAGDYKPFIFFAEVNLNQTLGLISDEEKERIDKLLESTDEDNFYIAFLAIKHIRAQRLKKFGANTNAPAYDEVKKNYSLTVISHDLFIRTLKK